MRESNIEGLASHDGPEPCVVVREGGGEASVGEHTGQPLSLAKIHIPGADAVAKAEGNTGGRVSASARAAQRGRRTWHVWKLIAREPGDPTGRRRPDPLGRGLGSRDCADPEVGPRHPGDCRARSNPAAPSRDLPQHSAHAGAAHAPLASARRIRAGCDTNGAKD